MPFTPTDYLPYDFANLRHIGPSRAEMAEMLATLGVGSLDELIDQTVPASIRQKEPLDFGKPKSERELHWFMRHTASKNKVLHSLIGQGYYGTVVPPVIQRNILENPAWYTSYTPYQPEISQGRLEALLNFQTMISDLTGLEIANASLLDEATACAEAMVMAQRVAKSKATGFFVDDACHPQSIAVMQTRAAPLGIEVIVGDRTKFEAEEVFAAIFQYPSTYGEINDFETPDPGAARRQGRRDHGRRSAGPDCPEGTGCHGRRYRGRVDPALRCADGLWRAARRLSGLPRCIQAVDAGPDCWRVDRQSRNQGLPAEPANSRAAHPPRKGDLERLYGTGALGRDGLVLCGFSRARRVSRP